MTPEEFDRGLCAAAGVITSVQENRSGRLSDDEYTAFMLATFADVGGSGALVLPLATIALRLAREFADEIGCPVEHVIEGLGLVTANHTTRGTA